MNNLLDKYPWLRSQLEDFEIYFLRSLKSRYPLISEVINELATAGGKRIRPALVFLSGQVGSATLEELMPVAAAVEIMHMATLVHDDIIDEAHIRRGISTTQSKYGKEVAVFTGDYLFAQSFLLLSDSVDSELMRRIAKSIKYICEGEIDQYQNRGNLQVSYLKYFRRTRRKTALLFEASSFSGAFLANLLLKDQAALAKFGKYLGMIFQITDDILDITSFADVTGKPVGNDFSHGVYTLPIIFALEDLEVGSILKEALLAEEIDKQLVIPLILQTDALAKTRQVVDQYAERADYELSRLGVSREVMFLKDLLKWVTSRNY